LPIRDESSAHSFRSGTTQPQSNPTSLFGSEWSEALKSTEHGSHTLTRVQSRLSIDSVQTCSWRLHHSEPPTTVQPIDLTLWLGTCKSQHFFVRVDDPTTTGSSTIDWSLWINQSTAAEYRTDWRTVWVNEPEPEPESAAAGWRSLRTAEYEQTRRTLWTDRAAGSGIITLRTVRTDGPDR